MRITVSILKKTPKACLVEANGRKGWLQSRWVKEDGTVKEETFTKAADKFDALQKAEEEDRIWREAYHSVGAPTRETEKAILIKVSCEEFVSDQLITRDIWFPKSLMRNENEFPGWFIRKKVAELKDQLAHLGVWNWQITFSSDLVL